MVIRLVQTFRSSVTTKDIFFGPLTHVTDLSWSKLRKPTDNKLYSDREWVQKFKHPNLPATSLENVDTGNGHDLSKNRAWSFKKSRAMCSAHQKCYKPDMHMRTSHQGGTYFRNPSEIWQLGCDAQFGSRSEMSEIYTIMLRWEERLELLFTNHPSGLFQIDVYQNKLENEFQTK